MRQRVAIWYVLVLALVAALGVGAILFLKARNPARAAYWAVVHGDEDTLREILDQGFDPRGNEQMQPWREHTLLHVAAEEGQYDIARILVGAGADIDSTNRDQETPLMRVSHAEGTNSTSFARFLVDRGADLRRKDIRGWTALHHAAARSHLEVAVLLVKRGADVDARAADGSTPLHLVCTNLPGSEAADRQIVDVLLKAGANLALRTTSGETALDLAIAGNRRELISLLR